MVPLRCNRSGKKAPIMNSSQGYPVPAGVAITGAWADGHAAILTAEAIAFLADLERRFGGERNRLLGARVKRRQRFEAGEKPGFLPETAAIRAGEWTVAPLPTDLQDRRVEITGPVDRKMVINALNAGARVFMADFEDSNTPTWTNQIEGQINLRDAVARTIAYTDPTSGKQYALRPDPAVLMVRPRGWHLDEAHMAVDGRLMSGSLFDFGLFFFHNARALLDLGSGPYFYLPKLESHTEAALWNAVFTHAQAALGIPHGSIRATVLIETLPAAFEMDEILYELRDHSAGLNCGRWDYIFSFIKTFRRDPAAVLPDRAAVTMATPFMTAYSLLVIKTCHRRGAPAMGGMAALIPIKGDEAANEAAIAKVRADKEREARNGHDGTWVAHPALVPVAQEVFDRLMPTPNQIHVKRSDVEVSAADLLAVPAGAKTEAGLRMNVAVAIGYIESWLRGVGCVPLFNLMEDAATAEISRAQLWQWLHHSARLEDGRAVDSALLRRTVEEELAAWRGRVGDARYAAGRYTEAAALLVDLVDRPDFVEFLTLPAYVRVVAAEG
jgi:malate synthase